MTEIFESTSTHDPRRALAASGLLRTFNQAGVIESADVQVAGRLGVLAGESDEAVLLAAALAVRAVRHGSICVDLAAVPEVISTGSAGPALPWPAFDAVATSPLLAQGALRLEFGLLYLDRYHRQERQVHDDLAARETLPPPTVDEQLLVAALDRVFKPGYAEQREAAAVAARRRTTILTGGPGTGKTTTVAGLLAVLSEQQPHLSVALTAPTGKAAARLQESVLAELAELDEADRARVGQVQALTLHRLLGWRPDNATRFRHDRRNRLKHDLIVVDETSMVGLTMMARLLEAVRPETRLVLVGDPQQLSSVEAGAVLTDLVAGYHDRADSPVVRLERSHRFGPEISALAEALQAGFFNIDVDTSTLVDLSQAGHVAQQQLNGGLCAELTAFIREREPAGVTVSVGGEIGEVGGKNSTPEELEAFMTVYLEALHNVAAGKPGISKISIQTGTSHGGVPLPDGSIAQVKIDFDALERCSAIAREKYGMAGAVQHGASTLPAELFDRFPKLGACEIHLATEFQNMIYDHPLFPADLKREIYERLRVAADDERKASDTDEQFFYKTRKKALGMFKRELWGLPQAVREGIGQALEDKFTFLLAQLSVGGTQAMAAELVPFVPGSFPMPGASPGADKEHEDVTGLAD